MLKVFAFWQHFEFTSGEISFDKYRQLWTNVNNYGHMWAIMDKLKQFGANVDQTGK